jgi:lysophospholipase L1-like esterase
MKYEYSYPYLLEKLMIKNYPEIKIINSGIGGNTILDGLNRLQKDALSYNPDFIIVNFGLNDGMLKEKKKYLNDTEQLFYKDNNWYYVTRVNIDDFKYAYSKLINILKSKEIKILLLSINPTLDSFPLSEDNNFKKKQKEIYEVYNERIIQIAANSDVDYIDLWEVFVLNNELERHIQEDGIHPNEAGLELIAESVYSYFLDEKVFD